MTRRIRPWLCLGLCLAAACERAEKNERAADDNKPASQVTHAQRETSPNSGHTLRAALAEAQALTDPQARDKALAQVAWNALEQDEKIAREAFNRMAPDSPQRIALIQHFAMRMADEDPDAALAWSGTLASQSETAAAQARIALVIAPTDPARAANLLSESGLPSREFDVAIVQVLRHWAGQSPPDAAAWVAVFPEGGFRKAGVSRGRISQSRGGNGSFPVDDNRSAGSGFMALKPQRRRPPNGGHRSAHQDIAPTKPGNPRGLAKIRRCQNARSARSAACRQIAGLLQMRPSSRATIIKVSRTPGANLPSACTASTTEPSRMKSSGVEPT